MKVLLIGPIPPPHGGISVHVSGHLLDPLSAGNSYLRRIVEQRTRADRPLPEERRAMIEGNDIIIFSNDWGGDPLSKHQIAWRLARKNRILWVNSMGNRNPTYPPSGKGTR